jgi:transcriptional regulator with XRE-family HTH domain
VNIERIGPTVRRWRRRRGLTQEALAARAGLSRPFVARVETSRQVPSLPTLARLARALRVPLGTLLE